MLERHSFSAVGGGLRGGGGGIADITARVPVPGRCRSLRQSKDKKNWTEKLPRRQSEGRPPDPGKEKADDEDYRGSPPSQRFTPSTASRVAVQVRPYGKIRLNTNGWERETFSMAAWYLRSC